VNASLLSVEKLTLHFATRGGMVRALDDVWLGVASGEMLGVVGESGSGKSVTAYAVMRLLDPAARILSGAAFLDGTELLSLPERRMRRLRGAAMGMVFQSARTALNPIRRVGAQLADALRAHQRLSRTEAAQRAVELLSEVRIADPERRARAYPFELSGGMCQRVMVALALAGHPRLLIADEPTTGLDVTVQAAVMQLITGLVRERGMGCLFITHDLLLAAGHCDRIAVMHAGQVVETGPAAEIFAHPRHPYTAKLVATAPRPDMRVEALVPIAGSLPDLRRTDLPACRYMGRCERASAICADTLPQTPRVRCHHPL
jgi:peptide/nickel transport system ATP-binding protein